MPKKPRVRTQIDNQQVKEAERLLESARQDLCHIFWSLWKKVSSKSSFLIVSEILRLFVNIFTPDEKYSLSVKASVERNQFKCDYLQIKKYVANFFQHLRNLRKDRNTLKKKMNLKGYLFLKL